MILRLASLICVFVQIDGFTHTSKYTLFHDTSIKGSFRDNNFMNPLTKERLQKGLLTPRELDTAFNPSKAEIDSFLKITSIGFAAVIIDLDTALVDLKQLCGYSYALLAGEISQPTPNPKKVYDTIGSSFKTAVTSFGWDLDMKNLESYEDKYYQIFEKLLNMMPIESHFGAIKLINELIRNGDQITVCSSLPRALAINVLKKAQLSSVFEGRVSPDHLICRDDFTEQKGEGYSGQRIIQCCGLMTSPTMLAVYIDGNRRNVMAAKRDGLGVIALQGYAENPFDLKAADLVAPSIDSLTALNIYKVIRHRIEHSEGGGQQTASGAARQGGGGEKLSIAVAPAPRPPKNEGGGGGSSE